MTSSVDSALHHYAHHIEKVHTSIVKFSSLCPQKNHNVQQYSYRIVENFDVFDAFQLDRQNLTCQIV